MVKIIVIKYIFVEKKKTIKFIIDKKLNISIAFKKEKNPLRLNLKIHFKIKRFFRKSAINIIKRSRSKVKKELHKESFI